MRLASVLSLSVLLACGASQREPTHSDPYSAAPPGWDAWREARTQSLGGEEGWLTLVALCWIDEGALTIGAAEDSGCRLSEHAPPRIGRVVVEGSAVHFVVEPGVTVEVDGVTQTEVSLLSDASETYTVMTHGPLRMHLIDRGGRLGIRIKDRESSARLSFLGVPVFDYHPRFAVAAHFTPAAPGSTLPIVNVLGMQIDEPIAGTLTFELGGARHTLIAMPNGDAPEDGLFVMLRDASSGESTYGAGRYLDVPVPDADGNTVMDLNFLETPPCGFTELATCPLPPPENELEVALEVGERWLGDH